MKRNKIYLLIGILIFVGGGVAFWRVGPESQNSNVSGANALTAESKAAPDFSLSDYEGHSHRLSELKGNVIVLHFWASWCPPCLSEIPTWVELANHFKNQPLRLVAVSLDEKWADAQKILPSAGLPENLLSLIDTQTHVPDLYGTYQYPETYVIGRDQKILVKLIGPQDWSGERITKLLDEILRRPFKPDSSS